jgi:hypothetical protein
VEVPDLDAQKSNNKVNSASEQSRQLQETRDLAQDTRCVVDIMAMQIKLLTDALMEADVINEEDEDGFSYRVGDRAEVQETFKEIEAKDGTCDRSEHHPNRARVWGGGPFAKGFTVVRAGGSPPENPRARVWGATDYGREGLCGHALCSLSASLGGGPFAKGFTRTRPLLTLRSRSLRSAQAP